MPKYRFMPGNFLGWAAVTCWTLAHFLSYSILAKFQMLRVEYISKVQLYLVKLTRLKGYKESTDSFKNLELQGLKPEQKRKLLKKIAIKYNCKSNQGQEMTVEWTS